MRERAINKFNQLLLVKRHLRRDHELEIGTALSFNPKTAWCHRKSLELFGSTDKQKEWASFSNQSNVRGI